MKSVLRISSVLILALGIAIAAIGQAAAQTTAPSAVQSLSGQTVRALQEALNKQGITVKVDGAISDELRAAIRKYQSQHHLPVTGEPDKATLEKLGVAVSSGAAAPSAAPTAAGPQGNRGMMTGPGTTMGPGMMPGGQGMMPAGDQPKR